MNNNLLNCQGTPQPLDNILEKYTLMRLKSILRDMLNSWKEKSVK